MQFTFRTSPPATYLSPTAEEMREAAQKVGIKSFSKDLVADLANLAAGGRINPPSAYREEIRRKAEETLPAADSSGYWSITVRKDGKKTDGWTKSRAEAIEARVGEQVRYHQNVCDFLQTVDLAKFPGQSPLEQAMACLKLLSKQQDGAGGGEVGEPLPIFYENDRPEGVAESLHDTLDMAESLSEDEQAMLDPDGKNSPPEKSPEGDGGRDGHKSELEKLAVAEDLTEGSGKRVMLDISRKLDSFSKLQLRKQVKLEEDPAGEEIRQRPIKHLGELSKVAKTAWATRQQNPSYFLYQAVSGQLPVRERVTRIEKKQAVFILIDGSGSMSGRKHFKASGVVMNRLKAVLSGDAEVWVSVFDTQLGKVSHAATPDEAKALIKKFSQGNFSGGGTDIAAAVKVAHAYIEAKVEAGEALYRPEIVVLTDEDSSVGGMKPADIPGTRVHGFAMEVANPSLVKFAQATGGLGIDKF